MNAIAKDRSQMTGLEQLRAIFDPDRPERRPGIGKTMGFDLVEVEEGRVVFGGHPDETVYNPSARCMAATRRRCWTAPSAARSTRC